MYLRHFGLREAPFSLTPDTSFFFACSSYQEALNTLLVAARNGEGFIKITGEVGNGKTLLCRKFLATLNQGRQSTTLIGTQDQAAVAATAPRFITAYIPNPYLEPRSLLLALAEEFRVPLEKDADQYLLLKGLTRALLECARNGQRALVCLDEAQAMPLESLEVLRLLTNLETENCCRWCCSVSRSWMNACGIIRYASCGSASASNMTCKACVRMSWNAICAIVWQWPDLPVKHCSAPRRWASCNVSQAAHQGWSISLLTKH